MMFWVSREKSEVKLWPEDFMLDFKLVSPFWAVLQSLQQPAGCQALGTLEAGQAPLLVTHISCRLGGYGLLKMASWPDYGSLSGQDWAIFWSFLTPQELKVSCL